jgi:hypothetical protein
MTNRTIAIVAAASTTETAPIAIPAPRLGGNDSEAVPIPPMITAHAAKTMPMMKNGVSLFAASAARINVACVIAITLPNAAARRYLAPGPTFIAALGCFALAVVVAAEIGVAVGALGGLIERHK